MATPPADHGMGPPVLPAGARRTLTDEEMATCRAPYVEPDESRRPTLIWPREATVPGLHFLPEDAPRQIAAALHAPR